jgi:hypothetical protein
MRHENLLSLIGVAGSYPLTASDPPLSPHWQVFRGHASHHLRQGAHLFEISYAVIEQHVLESVTQPDEGFSLRLSLCGCAWHGTKCFGRHWSSLEELQALLDTHGPTYLEQFAGDFVLCYVPPDCTCCCLYRSLTGTHTIFYRLFAGNRGKTLVWSTNIGDLFLGAKPTLEDVDHEMVAVLTATGISSPERTGYREIKSLPAGTCITFSLEGTPKIWTHDYFLREDNSRLSLSQAASRLREYVEAAVQRSLYGFSPVHVFLSGGLDTAILAYEARKLTPEVHGFHWTWKTLPMFRDERGCAEQLAQQLGLHLHTLDFSPSVTEGGNYTRCMEGLPLSYNHDFYTCFAETANAVADGTPQVIASGHMGDTSFQGDWADAFRFSSRWPHPGTLIKTLTHLLSWYPRSQALAVFGYLLGPQSDVTAHSSEQRIHSCQAWMTPKAFQQAKTLGSFAYQPLPHPSLSTRKVQTALREVLHSNTELDMALFYEDFYPRNVLLVHPYIDRALQEFCLSLAPHHRTRFFAGFQMTKVLLRLAYLGDLPSQVISREARSPYSAVAEEYFRHNQQEAADLFGAHAQLTQWGIIDTQRIQAIIANPVQLQHHSRSLLRAAGVEMWLRTLAGQSTQKATLKSHTPLVSHSALAKRCEGRSGVAQLKEETVAYEINKQIVLFNHRNLDVSRLNGTGTFIWQTLMQETTWLGVINAIHQSSLHADTFEATKKLVHTFVQSLVDEGWILLVLEEKKEDVFSTNDRNDLY